MDYVVLENGIEYLIANEINHGNNCYVYLMNENNSKDFCIRKKILENNHEFLIGLDDENEFEKALNLFLKKIV
ncbi:MAG: hypothetical protein NC181_05020 [Clostridium sp.]|nr:hypothetical protein [Clostridium sp.]MCM1444661.1 hypothetical protein [Candidatus Amulumruptor caecigallinarius]